MRSFTNQETVLQRHSEILALQQLQLYGIQEKVAHPNALSTSQMTASSTASVSHRRRFRQKRFCLPLPQWVTSRTWTFAAFQSYGSWTMEMHSVHRRPFGTAAFECVRRGDLVALQKGLATGDLSIWDVTQYRDLGPEITLLGVIRFPTIL